MNSDPKEIKNLSDKNSVNSAKPVKRVYRWNLPHLQAQTKPLFVTFSTMDRWILPGCIRTVVLKHCLYDHGRKIHLYGAVVMPDHVHMIFVPLRDLSGNIYGIAEIMNGIKGSSAHTINKALERKGTVWQDESFDHILRSAEKLNEKVEYICNNPVRKGLVRSKNEYPWLWENPELGMKESTAGGGCAA